MSEDWARPFFRSSTGTTSSSTTFSWSPSVWLDPDEPYLFGGTQPEFSTSTELVPVEPALIWDVNRYYRDLGIEPPYRPSRPEIRRAFRLGPRGARETFCLRQLMNREVRARYDATPWGYKMMDPYVWAEQKERALTEMIRRRMDPEDEDLVRTVFAKLGIPVEPPEPDAPDSPEMLDSDSKPVQDGGTNGAPATYAFAYYLWKTIDRPQDREILAAWQPLIIRAMSVLGARMRVSLGLMGRTPYEWSTGMVGRRAVAYLNRDTEPSEEVATKVAAELARDTADGAPKAP